LQTSKLPYEIICINDGSLDNSISILEDYRKQYNFVHVILDRNRPVSIWVKGRKNIKNEHNSKCNFSYCSYI